MARAVTKKTKVVARRAPVRKAVKKPAETKKPGATKNKVAKSAPVLLPVPPPPPAPVSTAPALPVARMEPSAQVLDFEPGLYTMEVGCKEIARVRPGFSLPCVRLDPLPPAGHATGRAHIASLSDLSLILPGGPAAYVRVEGGLASILLTIYKVAGAPHQPELRIRRVDAAQAAPPQAAASAPPPVAALPTLPLTLLAHIEGSGDVKVPGGIFAAGAGSIEGFAITPESPLAPTDMEYQAVLGKDWNTPWVPGGEFCGSRGLALPLLGIRVRLRGEAAKRYKISYWAQFEGKPESGPFADGALCGGSSTPLKGLRVVLSESQPAPPAKKPRTTPAKPKK